MPVDRTPADPGRPGLRSHVAALALRAAWLACATAAAASAQVLPLAPELQVNGFTTGFQSSPRVAVADDGTFVVVWGSLDQSPAAVRARRFDALGVPLGGEVPVSVANPEFPSDLSVAANGEFVVVWGRGDAYCPQICTLGYVSGRRLSAQGTPLGDQFEVSAPPGSLVTGYSTVASHPGGEFVVVWFDSGLFGRRFSAQAVPQGGIFAIAPGRPDVAEPAVAAQAGGEFLVTWSEYEPGGGYDLRAQRFAADATPSGTELVLAGPRSDRISNDLATEPDGDFLVAWTTLQSPGSSVQVEAARFLADGTPVGAAFTVNTYSAQSQHFPRLHRESSGGFVVAWTSTGSPGDDASGWSVQARRLAADGTPLGPQFQVNSYTTGHQTVGAVGSAPNGDLVFVWGSQGSFGDDDSLTSVQVRRFRTPFFVDGFESGDTGRWSLASP